MSEYRPPAIYEFPPLFTKQVNEQTWQAQKRHWANILVDYCTANKTWQLRRTDAIFTNPRIQRTLREDAVAEVLDHLVAARKAEWIDERTAVLMHLQSAETIAADIHSWAQKTGHSGAILTIYELAAGPPAGLEDLEAVDPTVLQRAVDVLIKKNQAVAMHENGQLVAIKLT